MQKDHWKKNCKQLLSFFQQEGRRGKSGSFASTPCIFSKRPPMEESCLADVSTFFVSNKKKVRFFRNKFWIPYTVENSRFLKPKTENCSTRNSMRVNSCRTLLPCSSKIRILSLKFLFSFLRLRTHTENKLVFISWLNHSQ